MVLLKPIPTPYDPSHGKAESNRTSHIREQLDRYNSWLPFVSSSSPDRKVRSAAAELQQIVHEINLDIAEMMIRFDRKMLELQDRTDNFVEAVKEGVDWQLNGDLLGTFVQSILIRPVYVLTISDLPYEELDNVLINHSQRNTDAHLKHLRNLVMKEADVSDPYNVRPPQPTFPAKILRLVQAVRFYPRGDYEAFHLYIFVKAHLFTLWDRHAFVPVASEADHAKANSLILKIINDLHSDEIGEHSQEPRVFYGFAGAKRELWDSVTKACLYCSGQQPYPSPTDVGIPPSSFQPHGLCRREPSLEVIEKLQMEAYGEIKSGILLTLTSKLPRELCLLVFEFAMEAEDILLDPRVWDKLEDISNVMMRGYGAPVHRWPVKKMYRCRGAVDNTDQMS